MQNRFHIVTWDKGKCLVKTNVDDPQQVRHDYFIFELFICDIFHEISTQLCGWIMYICISRPKHKKCKTVFAILEMHSIWYKLSMSVWCLMGLNAATNIMAPSHWHATPLIKKRRFHDRLIFIIGIPAPGKSFLLKLGPFHYACLDVWQLDLLCGQIHVFWTHKF